ncbi:hypothetical protein C8R45DRAFT_1109864 [Mycena sanguinolenta]|nr:hypothetical protein C8R45DRAFT_1109864 [Mycena sanguinolenta]
MSSSSPVHSKLTRTIRFRKKEDVGKLKANPATNPVLYNNREELLTALKSTCSTSPNDLATTTGPASSSARRRPVRRLGQTTSNAGHLIPEPIRRKFTGPEGWKTHELNGFFTVDGSSNSIVSIAKELPIDAELSLSFDEWFQAWGSLLELILAYVPEKHSLWIAHFESILTSDIDPSIFHIDVWNDLESTHIAKRTIAAVRRELNSNNSARSGRNNDTDRSHSVSGNRFQPYVNSKQTTSNNSFRPSGKFCCLVCGSEGPAQKSRS